MVLTTSWWGRLVCVAGVLVVAFLPVALAQSPGPWRTGAPIMIRLN